MNKLAAYILRAPVAYERMRYDRELGLVVFQIEHPCQEGPLVSVDVLDFLARLSLRMPEERERLPVYYGVYSNASKHRTNVDGVGRGDDTAEAEHDARECLSRARRWWRKKWAEMIRRVFLADPLTCPCGGQLRIVSFVTKREAIDKILRHIGWQHVDPPPPRYAPPAVPHAAPLGQHGDPPPAPLR